MRTTLRPKAIGVCAGQTIRAANVFSVRGITSRGIFLLVDEQTILFLSCEGYKGPLTINIPQGITSLDKVENKSNGLIKDAKIFFNDIDFMIDCDQSQVWSAYTHWNPTTLPPNLPPGEDLFLFLQKVLSSTENDMASNVLSLLEGSLYPCPASQEEPIKQMAILHQALHERDNQAMEKAAHFFVGRGRGLTPSGDDFLLGIVYGLSCLPQIYKSGRVQWIEPVVEIVYHRSTLVSANLLACASKGEVDERLGLAFHDLLTSPASSEKAITGLLTWGSSSGVDAAAGMVLLLSAIR